MIGAGVRYRWLFAELLRYIIEYIKPLSVFAENLRRDAQMTNNYCCLSPSKNCGIHSRLSKGQKQLYEGYKDKFCVFFLKFYTYYFASFQVQQRCVCFRMLFIPNNFDR